MCAAAVTEQVESIVGKDKLTFPSIAEIADQTPLNLDQAPQVLEAAKTLPDAASQAAEEAKQILSVDITPEDGEGLLDGAQNIMSSIGKSFSDTANNLRGSLNGSAPKSAQPDSFRNASVGEISLGRDQASEPVEILSSQSTSPAVDPIGQGATVSSNSGSASDAIRICAINCWSGKIALLSQLQGLHRQVKAWQKMQMFLGTALLIASAKQRIMQRLALMGL